MTGGIGSPRRSVTSTRRRVLKIVFRVSDDLGDDEVHELGEWVVNDLVTAHDVTFERTEVVDES